MTEYTNRQQLFQGMENARQELQRSLQFLSAEEAVEPGIHGGWTLRDVISHITGREATVFAAVRNLVEDGDPCFPDPLNDLQFNRAAVERRLDFSMREVQDELESLRQQIMKYLRKLPNKYLFSPYEVRASGEQKSISDVLEATIAHDYEHADGIWQWRAEADKLHRDAFRRNIMQQRHEFLNALGGMHEEDMVSVRVCGVWTVRDVMAHVLSWDEEAYHTAKHWTGERPWQDGALYDDGWNEHQVSLRDQMDVIELADGLATFHRKLLQLVDQRSDQELVAVAQTPWGESMSLLSFLYEMASHDSAHRPDFEAMGALPKPTRSRRK